MKKINETFLCVQFFCRQRTKIDLPMHVLIAIRTTEVGVDTFSLTLKKNIKWIKLIFKSHNTTYSKFSQNIYTSTNLNNKLRIEKEHISTPLPVMAEKIPPQKPVKINVNACQIPKLGI